ncbi:nitroreductase/quinone reductase family protein [Streptomyces sp. Z26]|uniref:nitroreductase/quinone reductase family protein n=1 Tax=Streptomyces sp. Z26 TaxID=2500177 RepID=UPI000EF14AE6|nr:nitroreductase/quinone reductase family protein [Streptomyces sp. Z26]RLL67711.1 nitroreductase family deazaflavin-dependent oxidoreductase [Streptomyces sp. Z26]
MPTPARKSPHTPPPPRTPATYQRSVIDEFRANGGRVGGPSAGSALLLLTTTGARSGAAHTVPLGLVRHDGLLYVVASDLGADRHPAWYHNLLAHPLVRVDTGAGEFEAIAVPAEGDRRDRLFAHAVRVDSGYADHQARTARTLPVVVLAPATPDTPAAPDATERPGDQPASVEVTTLADKLVEVHRWLRAQLRHVRAEADAYFAARAAYEAREAYAGQGTYGGPGAEPPAPGLGLQLRQHCLAFCQTLQFHHTAEDGHVFPVVARHHPELRDTLERLGREHRTVARVHDALLALLADLGGADPQRFRTELARMSAELEAHLDHEEESLLPALAAVPWPPGR